MTTQTHNPPDIDHLSIAQVACDGMRLRLKGIERDEAIRRTHGRIDAEIVAWRLHTTPRTVQGVAARLGLGLHHVGTRSCQRETTNSVNSRSRA